jgi:hypothetical protein
MIELLDIHELPGWFTYPDDFLETIRNGVFDIGPWQFLYGTWLRVRYDGLKKRFPDRNLMPFARRLDNDDVACWDQRKPKTICIVHDFSAPGWENREEFPSYNAWLLAAQEAAKDYD